MSILAAILGFVRAILRRSATLALENLALRQHYQTYYNEAPTHLSLDRNSPIPREVEPPSKGRVVAIPHLGGLHHRYLRAT